MELLRYAGELRDPADFFDEVPNAKPEQEMVDLAIQLIARKTKKFAPGRYEDHYQTDLHALVQTKFKGRKISRMDQCRYFTACRIQGCARG